MNDELVVALIAAYFVVKRQTGLESEQSLFEDSVQDARKILKMAKSKK